MKQAIKEERLSTDVLVIGGGIAGMFAAIKAKQKGLDVILCDKNFVGRSGGTHYAEGDIQFFRPKARGHVLKDWVDKLWRDTEYLANRDWLETILMESEDRYNDLVEWGIKFWEEDGQLWISGPHEVRDIPRMYEIVAMRNREYAPSIRSKALEEGVRVYDRMMFAELLKQDGRIVGAMAFNTTSGKLYTIKAKATILCTGPGTAYKVRVMDTDYWTGDGICMAYRAGAEITGMEFRQSTGGIVKPAYEKATKLYNGGGLEGQKKVDVTAKYPYCTLQSGWFWPNLTETNEPIKWWGAGEIHAGKGPIYCDLDNMSEKVATHHKKFFDRIDNVELTKIGLNVFEGGKLRYPSSRQELNTPIGGAGVWVVDQSCATTLPGLFTAGGGAATLISGAKYGGMGLGLNGGMVTGTHAANGAAEYISKLEDFELNEDMVEQVRNVVAAPARRQSGHSVEWVAQVLQHTYVPYFVSIYRHGDRMRNALQTVLYLKNEIAPNMHAEDPHDWRMAYETKNMIENAELTLKAATFREESRGSHFREDFPARNDAEWLCWVKMRKDGDKDIYTKEPIPDRFKPDFNQPFDQLYPMTFPDVVKVSEQK